MVQSDTGRHQEERKKQAKNRKGRIVGGKKKLDTVCPSTCIKTQLTVGETQTSPS